MATHRINLLAAVRRDASGNVYWKPSSLDDANDRFDHDVLAFKDSGTKIGASGSETIPQNWTNAAGTRIVGRWKSVVTTGAIVIDFEYKAVAAGESLDPSTDDEALTVTSSAPGTARQAVDFTIDLNETLLAIGDTFLFKLSRDGTDAADTMAAEALFEELWLEYVG